VVEEHGAHRVVALALPAVVAFDLSIAAQIFGHRDESSRYAFSVCSAAAGPLPTSTGFDLDAAHGLDALRDADTVVVPGFHPLDAPDEALVLMIVTLGEKPEDATANLLGPVVINTRTREGLQVVLPEAGYSTKVPLLAA